MKNILLLILILSTFFLSPSFGQNNKKPIVVATASMIADMAKNIAGDHMDVQTIVPIGGDPHIYRPTPSDAKMIVHADLILMNGLTFEGWLNDLINNSGTKAPIIQVTKGIETIMSITYNSPDPHAWMNALNGIIYSENIKNSLVQLDPEHATDYESNFQRYKKVLQELDEYITSELAKIPESKRILITSHDAFQYYGRKYNIRLESVLGISTDADVQTEDVINLQKVIKETDVPAVFVESTVNPKLLKQIAEDNNIEIGGKLLSDSLGDEITGGETYVDMLRQNTDVIVKALSKERKFPQVDTDKKGKENFLITGFIALLFLGGIIYMFRRTKQV